MKKRILLFLLLSLICILQSCENRTKKQGTEKGNNRVITNSTKKPEAKIYKGNFEFESYNDNGDYMLLNVKKGNNLIAFINDKNQDRSLLNGDICEIEWIKDTIYIAGDGETPEIADWLIHIKKIKEGKVSQFRKDYNNALKYHYSDDTYSQEYLDALYLLAEYYIAGSKNELITNAVRNREPLEYSIESRTENGKKYDVLGIGHTFEHRFSIMQWVYIDKESKFIYEYDLPNEKLVLFR